MLGATVSNTQVFRVAVRSLWKLQSMVANYQTINSPLRWLEGLDQAAVTELMRLIQNVY